MKDQFVMDENGTHWQRPATDPAGLDVEAVRHALRYTDWSADNDRALSTFVKAYEAALSVADGPGPA